MNKYYEKFKKDLSEVENYIWDDYLELTDGALIEDAILLLIKEGLLNRGMELNRFITVSRDRLSDEDLLFLINNKLIILKKINKEKIYSLINKINQDVIKIYSEYFFEISLEFKDKDLLNLVFQTGEEFNYYLLEDDNARFFIESITVDEIIKSENFKDNLEIIEYFTVNEMESIIDRNDVFNCVEIEDFIKKENSLQYLKKYIKQHMISGSQVDSEKEILTEIYDKDNEFVSNLILRTKNKKYVSFLKEDFESIEELVMNSDSSEVKKYIEKNINSLKPNNLSKIYNEFIEIGTLLFGKNSLIEDNIKDLVIKKLSNERLIHTINYELSSSNSDYNIENHLIKSIDQKLVVFDDFFIESSHFGTKLNDIEKFISYKSEKINRLIIKSPIELSKDQSLEILNNSLSEDLLLMILYNKKISGDIAISLAIKENFNIELISEMIFENKIKMNKESILLLIEKDIDINEIVSYCIKNEQSLENFNFIDYIDKINEDNLSILCDHSIFSINDIEKIDNPESNSFLLTDAKIPLNNNTIKRKVKLSEINHLIDRIDEESLKHLIPDLISVYSNEEELIKIINSIYFIDKNELYVKEILKLDNLSSKVLYDIIEELDMVSLVEPFKNKINSQDLNELAKSKYSLNSSFFYGRYSEISSQIKYTEDSKGVHLFLNNDKFILSYSTFLNKFKKSKNEYSDEDFVIFNNIINQINANPKKLKAKIYNDLSFNIIVNGEEVENSEFEINNLEEMRKWFIFFEKESLIVDLIRNCSKYEISFGKMKSKKEATMDFVNQVKKLDVSQIDNLIQDYRNFNPKRPYGIECEFSVQMDDYSYYEESQWNDLNKKDLINYIENNHENAMKNYIDRNDNLDQIKESLMDYMRDYDMITYNSDEEFNYIAKRFKKTVKNKDKKERSAWADKSYNSSDGHTWDLKTDESVADEDYGRLGIEIASPKLYGKSDLKIFKSIMKEFIYQNVDRDDMSVYNAGIHVHHDISDVENSNKVDIHNLKKELLPMQEMLFGIVDSSRRDNSYCKKYDYDDIHYSSNDHESINFSTNHGTIEFRMKEGTTSVEDIANWATLTHEITDKICKNMINKSIKNLEKKKGLFDKIMLSAQSVYERSVISKSEVENLFEMYNIAKNF